LRFILSHPLNRDRRLAAFARFVSWQVISRLRSEIDFRWIDGSTLKLQRGMTGGTGNVYCGLHEFVEMAFVLHLLGPADLFLDIGANVGSYTVLASKICRARTIAFEPASEIALVLERNVAVNDIADLVTVNRTALGERSGTIGFTSGLDTMNRVAQDGDVRVRDVPITRLDDIAAAATPTLIKLDVEGYEDRVLAGAFRVLSFPSLLAVLSERSDQRVSAMLGSFGFVTAYYDPFARNLAETPFGHPVSNMLYVRNRDAVMQRIATARHRRVLGKDL
jgi:FkbM family methyltransferase